MPLWPSSLRSRLTVWYGVLLGIPLVVFAVICYLVFAQALLDRTDRFIGDALTAFSRELVAERRAALSIANAMQRTVEEVHFRDLHIAILDTSGRPLAMNELRDGADNIRNHALASATPGLVSEVRALGDAQSVALTLPTASEDFRVVARPVVLDAQRFVLAGAYSLRDIDVVLARIRGMFLVAIPVLVVCAATGGFFLAKRSLSPVAAMAEHAAEIGASNLHERLPVSGGDELVGLAQVVNGLLDRLEHSFAQQRRFVADASHELRTPTAIVRAEADVTLSRAHRSEDEYRTSVAIMGDAARRLTRIVDDLFLLARFDAGHLTARHEPLYLEEVVHDAARGVRSVAEQRSVQIVMHDHPEAPFTGDADLLGRLVLNLLDNAIKYSPVGGVVDVTMVRRNNTLEVAVADSGPGIPAESRDRVFERFYRVDAARSRSETNTTSGAGLGLAIARRIAEIHGGRLDLIESRPGRTEFRLTLAV
ncbi:MAG: ATP-binding protein [Gemmatimonadota bacterium]